MLCDSFFEGNEYLESAVVTLWDFSAIEDFDLSNSDIEAIAVLDRITSFMNNRVTVLLVFRKEHCNYGRLYRFYARSLSWTIEIFTDRAKADYSKLLLLKIASLK
ncbi:MAG: hypothetical protein H6937_09280 [Burkholderiales bacterium]|nr:hypothetical protein [Burkholderiales bacterium]MDR4517513.1 hypothetical protein [Nitrosomonas sp.]